MDREREALQQHLSQISTMWTVLHQAHAPETGPGRVEDAQIRVLKRYGVAIYRYVLSSVRDPNVADELFQEFALRFVRGDFHRVDPKRGRFRDFLKTVLVHLIVDHHRQRQRQPLAIAPDHPEPITETPPGADSDAEFLAIWRSELLARAWDGLAEVERKTGQPLFTVLRFRTDHPDLRSHQIAEKLSERMGKPLSPEWVRKRVHYAREKFTELLLDEVAQSIHSPSLDDIERELLDLELLDRCRGALARRRELRI